MWTVSVSKSSVAALSFSVKLLAFALICMAFLKAVVDVDASWDTWMYHMPFAARLAGIIPENAYTMGGVHEHRYAGFPILAEFLQGIFWRATNRPESANLVSFFSFALYIAFLKSYFRVPWYLSVVGLLAIPLVQIHLTASYVDLPANLAFSALVLLCYLCYARDEFFTVRTILVITAAATVAINTKFQLIPLTSFVLTLVFFRMLWVVLERRKGGASTPSDIGKLVLPLVLAPVIFFTPVKNTLVHGNPLYPLHLHFIGIELSGPSEPYSSSPPALQNSFRPTRWLYSVMEIGIRPYDQPKRWTIDQWMPPETEGHRMGGFFNFYVLLSLILFAYFTYRSDSRTRRTAIGTFALLSLLASLMPQSHELRYYMYWMIVLVSLNLYLGTQTAFSFRNRSPMAAHALGVISSLFLAVVLWVTKAGYIIPSLYSFDALLYDKTNPKIVNKIQEKETVCLHDMPWSFLYASYFHNRNYQVNEAENPEACPKYRWIDVRNN